MNLRAHECQILILFPASLFFPFSKVTRHSGDEVMLISFLVGSTGIPSSELLLTPTLEPYLRYLTAVT